MPDMKLNAEVPLRFEGNNELHSIGTLKCPSTLGFGEKPTLGHKPGMCVAIPVDGSINPQELQRLAKDGLRKRGIR